MVSPATFRNGSTAYVSVTNDKFWSGTTYGKDHADAWYVEFHNGITYKDDKPDDLKVICVRYPLRDNDDGTITDRNLGLTWMKCPQGYSYTPATNGGSGTCEAKDDESQTFQYCTNSDNSCNGGSDGGILDSDPAFDSCDNLEHAGHTDWRVPTKDELRSLMKCTDGKTPEDESDCGSGNHKSPTVDTSVFPSNFPSSSFWTSSSSASNSSNAWRVFFSNGSVLSANKGYGNAVVCVR